PLRILLVEDHQDTLQIMCRLLRRLGYTVEAASSKQAAIEAARASEPDLLISDIGLPDGSGLDLMRELKSIRPLRGIALSGFGREADIARSREAGFCNHLVKPINFHELEEMIQQVAAE